MSHPAAQVVQHLIYQGMYVNLDFHSIGLHESLVTGNTPFSGADDYTLYDLDGWVNLWCSCLGNATHACSDKATLQSFYCCTQVYTYKHRPHGF
jgi:hypothetical protein